MKLRIPKDYFDTPTPPHLFLCTPGNKIIEELPAYDISLNASWNKYSELKFSIGRQYTDVITGETIINPLFDKAEGLRRVLVENMGYFIIQDPDETYSDKDVKSLSCFSSEYETGTKYLENFRINTGEVDSAEVMYLEDIYGEGYTIDTSYELAPTGASNFDKYESYYIKKYTDTQSYVYQQVAIADATIYEDYGEPLYRKKYPNVRFYWPTKPELSLLHLIFKKIPEWKLSDANVDVSLWRKERKFDEDRISVYDFLMNKVADTFKCVIEWDTLNGEVHFYEEVEDGIAEDNTIQTRFDTDIYITRENLANNINISYSSDDIKTKLKVTGSDDLSIRDVNLGKNHIINLDFYHNDDWMERDLKDAYSRYLKAVEDYSVPYSDAVSARAGAYNRWNDLMNAVPIEGNVVLIGDQFKKLYCSYTPIDMQYVDNSKKALIKQLSLYHVNDDVNGNQTDNILLRLKDKESNTVTIRVYAPPKLATKYSPNETYYKLDIYNGNDIYTKYPVTNDNVTGLYTMSENYELRYETSNASSGLIKEFVGNLNDWVKGEITADKLGKDLSLDLTKYTVSYIGTMGAYFVLAKDETVAENLEDYGIMLLREKYDTYTQIFQTQTENMYSQEKYQCFVGDDPPAEPIPDNTRWLDSDADIPKLYIYHANKYYSIDSYIKGMTYYVKSGSGAYSKIVPQPTEETFGDDNYYVKWDMANGSEVSATDKRSHEDYQRYLDNYNKLTNVQQMLVAKETEAEYCLNGYAISDMRINPSDYIPPDYLNNKNEKLELALLEAAKKHFPKDKTTQIDNITRVGLDLELPLYTFTCTDYPNTYLKATTYEEGVIYYIDNGKGGKMQALTQPTESDFANDTYYVLEKDYTFAVYLKNKIPYVAFASSVGVNQAKMDKYSQLTDFENFFTPDQWTRLSPLIREDEFNDNNFLLTGYESEEERMSICQELRENASKELKTLSQPSLKFSMNMGNILALPEFSSLTSQFELGNFIRIELRPGTVKRTRLLSVGLEFEDLSSFSCQFGNLVTTQDQIDLHAELMQQAVQAGKQVASSASNWQRAVDKSNKLEEDIANGLADATLEVGRASGQSIVWDHSGIWGRKLIEGTTDQYDDEQLRIINNKLLFSNDGFKTSKSVMGKFEVDGVEHWGLLAEAMIGGYIEGAVLKGGELSVGGEGGTFNVYPDGSVQILGPDKKPIYATQDLVSQTRQYHIELSYEGSTIFTTPDQPPCIITCEVYSWDDPITSKLPSDTVFNWLKNGEVYRTTTVPRLEVKSSDIEGNAQFSCKITFDETKIK